mmetsp:Transcript_10676/g.14968  ORF Transcript_10676/g.14968 Transcript_10676/m.14968 type:complete len:424 (-) Transcript_10676:47-1318(-)
MLFSPKAHLVYNTQPWGQRTTAAMSKKTSLFLLEKDETMIATVQDDQVDAPASVVFYDDVLDDDLPDGVVCARGVCVLKDDDFFFEDDDEDSLEKDESIVDKVLNSYIGPRALLAFASILYGTNFPLGAIMNDALPPSAATSARMDLAALALSPFLFKLNPALSAQALLCGCFTALGYTTQSLALVDVSPATVAFLGAATVIVCPTLEAIINKKPMSLRDQPQTWLAATLCIIGVGILELYDPTGAGQLEVGWGDVLSLLQAVGFGTSFFLTERMMRGQPDQALPITAVQVSTTALICMFWCIGDGWIGQPGSEAFGLQGLFFDPSVKTAALAVAWTGLITTAMNRFIETTALGKTSSAEASVILATEPLWAALFAALWLSQDFGLNDYVGGALIVAACLANSLKPSDFSQFFEVKEEEGLKP